MAPYRSVSPAAALQAAEIKSITDNTLPLTLFYTPRGQKIMH